MANQMRPGPLICIPPRSQGTHNNRSQQSKINPTNEGSPAEKLILLHYFVFQKYLLYCRQTPSKTKFSNGFPEIPDLQTQVPTKHD